VQPDPVDAPHAQRQQAPLVLQGAELALDRPALVVESLPPLGAPGIRVCSRPALTHADAGEHSPDGQRYLAAPRLGSAPANAHSPCSHCGGLCSPRLTAGVSRSGITGRMPRLSTSV
jgi:hypothetical protein